MAEDIRKLQSSIDSLQREVRELREVVNMLIDIIVTIDGGEEVQDAMPPYVDFDKERDQRFSM